jgi:hypothetical protein
LEAMVATGKISHRSLFEIKYLMLQSLKEFILIPIQFFQTATKLHYAAIGFGLVVAFLYFCIFFRDASGFGQDVAKANKIPLLDRDYDYIEKKWSHQKIMIWLALSVGSSVLAYHQLPDWFPQWFTK